MRARSMITIDGTLINAEIKSVPALCKTIDKKISGTKKEVMTQIADLMARCWWMFGEGRYEEILHGSKAVGIPDLFDFGRTETKCHICYTLMIDEIKDNKQITHQELIEYLYTNPYPKIKQHSYLNYIQKQGGPGMVGFVGNVGTIEPNHVYAISVLPKLASEEQTSGWNAGLKTVIGGAVAVGAVTCIVATGGVCGFGIATFAAKSALLAGGLTAFSGIEEGKLEIKQAFLADMFKERDFSSIYFSDLKNSQNYCGNKDIAGQ